jgi:hypothetical protein
MWCSCVTEHAVVLSVEGIVGIVVAFIHEVLHNIGIVRSWESVSEVVGLLMERAVREDVVVHGRVVGHGVVVVSKEVVAGKVGVVVSLVMRSKGYTVGIV